MAHSKAINFEIIKRLKETKIDFAFPTKALQIGPVPEVKEAQEKK
jgi:small-conductance mechanosensitive channel